MTKKSKEKQKRTEGQRPMTRRQLSRWQRQQRWQRITFGIGITVVVAVFLILGLGWYLNNYRPLHQTIVRVDGTKFDMDYFIKTLGYYGAGQTSYGYLYQLGDQVVEVIKSNELMRLAAPVSVSESDVEKQLADFGLRDERPYRDLVRGGLLLTKMRDEYFEQQVPKAGEQRQIVAMFLESESEALEIRAKLEAGEDFAMLAEQSSLDTYSRSKKGDLGWMPKGVVAELLDSKAAEEAAFAAEVDALSRPILDATKEKRLGYWLAIKLEEKTEQDKPKQVNVKVMLLGSRDEALSVRARLEAGEDFATLAKQLSQHEASKEKGGELGWVAADSMTGPLNFFLDGGELNKLGDPIRDDTVATKGGYWLIKIIGKEDNKEIDSANRDILKGIALDDWLSSLMKDPKHKVESYLDDAKKTWAVGRLLGIQ